jgi:hypothetical protein
MLIKFEIGKYHAGIVPESALFNALRYLDTEKTAVVIY